MADPILTYPSLAERNVSFQLIRTNPKLTTNVKLTVDSNGGLWFNSINANDQLANQKYKRFPINESSNHEINLYRFYDNGKTPTNIAYQVGSTINKAAVAKDLKDQYDFDLYTSGAKYLVSKQYSEKFSYLAPLYVDDVLPTKFVIFKVPGASNYTAGIGKSLETVSIEDFATDLFKKATIVKVFDMGKTSKIGKYLEKILTNPMFKKKPLYINQKENGYSLYRGASIKSGTYVEIPEQLSTVFSRSLPLLTVEEFVTSGYERNSIVYPKIINLEFLFNDDTSNPYEFNRYFGFYCNTIDLEEFDIDLDKMYESKIEIKSAVDSVSNISSSAINNDVSVVRIDQSSGKIYVGGSFTQYNNTQANRLIRLNQDGSIDLSFNTGSGFNDSVLDVQLGTDGLIYVCGNFTNYNLTTANRFVILNPDGSIHSADVSLNDSVEAIALSEQCQIHLTGKFSSCITPGPVTTPASGIIKLNKDLSINLDFIYGTGLTITPSSNLSAICKLLPFDKLLVIGQFSNYNGTSAQSIVQVKPDGTIDSTFVYGTGFNIGARIEAVELDQAGRIYLGGTFTSYNGTAINNLVRLNSNGSIDQTFKSSINGTVNSIKLDETGLIYVGGSFTEIHGIGANHFARLMENGEIDKSFNTTSGANNTVYSIEITEDSAYIGGAFTSYDSINSERLIKLEIDSPDNDQDLPSRFDVSDDISFTLTNSSGVKLRAKNLNQDLSDLNFNRTSKDTLFFPYIQDKLGEIHLINSDDWHQDNSRAVFKVDNTSFDLGLLFGPTDLISQPTAIKSEADTHSTICIEATSMPSHLDTIRIYHPSGTNFDINDAGGKYDDIKFVQNYQGFPTGKNYSLTYLPNGQSVIYVKAEADLSQISEAISDIIYQFRESSIFPVVMGTRVFVQSTSYGDTYGQLKVRVINSTNSQSFKINNEYSDSLIFADGGFVDKNHALIEIGNISKLTPQLDEIAVKTTNNWSRISRLYNATDLIMNGLSESDQANAISQFLNFASIQLVDNEEILVNYDKIEIRKIFRPKIGVLSLFDIHDFDYLTYSTRYSKNLLLDLYKDFFLPANAAVLDFTKYSYSLVGDGSVEINGQIYRSGETVNGITNPLIWQKTEVLSKYTVVSGSPILVYAKKLPNTTIDSNNLNFPDRTDISIYDESADTINYLGPFSIKAGHVVSSSDSATYQYREKYLYGNVKSEYHVYLENFTQTYSSTGRVTPYILKWGFEDSTDCRDNPYRLNSDIMFGKDNFGPSHRETAATPEKMTHEWFYIESDFGYSVDPYLARLNFSYFDQPLDVDQLSSSETYFEEYFTYVPTVENIEIGRPQYRYSTLNKNSFTKQYETLFKGALFRFYELDDSDVALANTNRFENYKFSAILKPIKEEPSDTRQAVKYRVIENTNAKAITVLIELAIGHKDQIPSSLLSKTSSGKYKVVGQDQLQNSLIDQASIFTESYQSSPISYQIDAVIGATSLAQYMSMLNGTAQLTDGVTTAQVGQTVLVSYGGLSAIIATIGSNVYDSVLSGQISNGDKLSNRVYARVDQGITVSLAAGTFIGVKIEALFQDGWATGTPYVPHPPTLAAGDLAFYDSSNNPVAYLDNTVTKIYIHKISADSTVYTPGTVDYYFEDGAFNQSSKLDQILQAGNIVKFTHSPGTNQPPQEISYTISAVTETTNQYYLQVSYSAGAFTGSATAQAPILLTNPWFIPLYSDPDLSASSSFAVQHKTAAVDSMFGDYRVEFNQTGVSNLTHSFLYYAKNKKYNNQATAYSTVSLSRGIDLSLDGLTYNTITGLIESIKTVALVGLENYDSTADSEMEPTSIGFTPIYLIKPGEKSILVQIDNTAPVEAANLSDPNFTQDGIIGTLQNSIITSQVAGFSLKRAVPIPINLGDSVTYSYSGTGIPAGSTINWITLIHQFQIFGGKNYFEKVFQNLSFAKFVQLLDRSQTVINWETYVDGVNQIDKKIAIEVIPADEISKTTIVQIDEDVVRTGQINGVAGYSLSEVNSQEYSIFRYSGEYDILTRPISGFKYEFSINQNQLIGANVCLNPKVDNFFVLPEFEYVKYAKTSILDLENSQSYSPAYSMIGETPIDRTDFNVLSSSWDYNYHFEYTGKSVYSKVPGSRRVTEDYSFVSKLINLPMTFMIEEFTVQELNNQDFVQSTALTANIVYSVFANEVRFKINLFDLIVKHLSNNGLRDEFKKHFKDLTGNDILTSSEFFGEFTFEEYLYQYCLTNLVKLYQVDSFEFYSLNDSKIARNMIDFVSVEYDSLGDLGYRLARAVKINNTKTAVIEGSVSIKPNTGMKVVPKIKIKFI